MIEASRRAAKSTVVTERPVIPADVIERFRAIDTNCLADTLHALRLNCLVQGIRPLKPGMKVCGPAFTVRYVSLQDPSMHMIETRAPELLEMCQPGDVLVMDAGGRTDVCTWGSNVSRGAMFKGLGGVVIDGATRDSAQILEVGLPVFARDVCMLHPHGILRTVCVNTEPVQIGVLPRVSSVSPGDLVIGDDDGIVVVPGTRAGEILERAEARHQSEDRGFDSRRWTSWTPADHEAYRSGSPKRLGLG